MTAYPVETLGEWDDDGTMVESLEALKAQVVGHKIVAAEKHAADNVYQYGHAAERLVLTLDDGRRVIVQGVNDCCAYTELEAFLLHPERVDHIITGVGTTGEFTTWHVYADAGDVLELTVDWSPGNQFYYGYGFDITVQDLEVAS